MNLTELKSKLDAADVSERAYSFTTDGIGEVYRLQRISDSDGDGWQVYYAERGQRTGLKVFRSESDACAEMLRRILHDPLTRRAAYPGAGDSKPMTAVKTNQGSDST